VALSILKKLALTSLTSGGRSVDIVRLWTEAMEFFILLILVHVSVVRPSSCRNILLTRITQLTTDPLFLDYS
jgi:hypothetical protein